MRPSGGRAGRQGWWSEIAVTRSGCFGGRKQGAWDQIVPLPAILQRAWKSRRKGRNTPADTQPPPGNLPRLFLRQCATEGMTPQFSAENIALAQYP